MKNYYSISPETSLNQLNSSLAGLDSVEVDARTIQYGKNVLIEKKKTTAWMLLLNQFKDLMIVVLILASILSGMLGDLTDTYIILAIILINATVGFYQEFNAEKALEALKKLAVSLTKVRRGNVAQMIPSEELVPGDIVLLESGNIIPADMRILESHLLSVDESSLTGESLSVDKNARSLEGSPLIPADQTNMLFKGSVATRGRAVALVTATGMQTELGRIAGMLQEEKLKTPLQDRMLRFGKSLSYVVFLICIILFVAGLVRGEDPFSILLISISLAVAAIPEALPVLIVIALARGASRLAKKNALIRKLPAVETLGSVSFICSDKTGTLTQNRMQLVEKVSLVQETLGRTHPELELAMCLNHDVKYNVVDGWLGDPTEKALVEYAVKTVGMDTYENYQAKFPRIRELPFDADRKCMTTVHHFGKEFLILTKGAHDAIAGILLDKYQADGLLEKADYFAHQGIRVIAFSYKICHELPEEFNYQTIENGQACLGFAGLADPERKEVSDSLRICREAGIQVMMITGDHPATASYIARNIGLIKDQDKTLSGSEIANMLTAQFESEVEAIKVFARVTPEQKLNIIKALQRKGHVVAMTGDGVNDAASLKAANIGVAMGITGTDVSKAASDMILLDDHFETIVHAIYEGRRVYDNIRKFIKYILTCNTAEIWTILLAPLMSLPIPLLPVQLLWINLVTDGFPALALARERAEHHVMKRPPRPLTESIFSDGLGYHIIWVGLLMAGVTLGIQAWATVNSSGHWQTMVFTVLAFSQLGHVMAVKSDRTFLYEQGIFSNKFLMVSVIITFILQMLVIYWPVMHPIFKTQPLTPKELMICLMMSVVVFHAVEFEKWIKYRWKKSKQSSYDLI